MIYNLQYITDSGSQFPFVILLSTPWLVGGIKIRHLKMRRLHVGMGMGELHLGHMVCIKHPRVIVWLLHWPRVLGGKRNSYLLVGNSSCWLRGRVDTRITFIVSIFGCGKNLVTMVIDNLLSSYNPAAAAAYTRHYSKTGQKDPEKIEIIFILTIIVVIIVITMTFGAITAFMVVSVFPSRVGTLVGRVGWCR